MDSVMTRAITLTRHLPQGPSSDMASLLVFIILSLSCGSFKSLRDTLENVFNFGHLQIVIPAPSVLTIHQLSLASVPEQNLHYHLKFK